MRSREFVLLIKFNFTLFIILVFIQCYSEMKMEVELLSPFLLFITHIILIKDDNSSIVFYVANEN